VTFLVDDTPTGADAPRARDDLESLQLDGETVLRDPASGRVFRLDRVGSVVWPFLDGTATIDALATDVADAFDAPIDDVRQHLVRMVHSLRASRLVDHTPRDDHDHEHDHGESDPDPATPSYLVDPPAP
jgi:hypothetical protein